VRRLLLVLLLLVLLVLVLVLLLQLLTANMIAVTHYAYANHSVWNQVFTAVEYIYESLL